MRRRLLPVLALPLLVASAAPPAHAAGGVCSDASGAAYACTPSVVACAPGDTVTVEVFGFGRGYATCGDVDVECRTLELSYCRSDAWWITTAGTLTCRAEPFEPSPAVAVCTVTPGPR